jgi:hypothetical protein
VSVGAVCNPGCKGGVDSNGGACGVKVMECTLCGGGGLYNRQVKAVIFVSLGQRRAASAVAD